MPEESTENMSAPEGASDTIPRAKVARIAENIKHSAEDVLRLVACEEVIIDKLLEITRFMARSARRIAKRANWTVGAPAPGNELESERMERERPRKAPRTTSREGAPRERRGPGGPRGGGSGGPRRGPGGPRRGPGGGAGGGSGGGYRGRSDESRYNDDSRGNR